MARLGPEPIYRHTNTDETLLKGGKIYTYASGASTTAKATYSDAALTIKNSNPIILDSIGEAKIYLKADGEYRFVIKDANDVTLRTVDNVNGIRSPEKLHANLDVNSLSIISSSNGDINITPDGTGRVILDGLTFPETDGTSGQVISTDGEGNLSFGLDSFALVLDTTPQLGGDLDGNGSEILMDSGTGIRDDSDNEQLIFTKTTSAVNYFEITNAATGNPPAISVAGSDTDVSMNISAKGSGVISQSGLSFPANDGVSGAPYITDGDGTCSLEYPTGATQAELEAGTSSAVWVTPAGIKHAPGVAKAWALFSGSANTILSSYGIASITSSVNHYYITFSTAFSSTEYVAIGSAVIGSGSYLPIFTNQAADTIRFQVRDSNDGTESTANEIIALAFYGDQ